MRLRELERLQCCQRLFDAGKGPRLGGRSRWSGEERQDLNQRRFGLGR